MNSLNSVILEGNLVKDPVSKQIGRKGVAVCRFRLASNRFYKTENSEKAEEVSFFEVEAWAGQAENCSKYLSRGRAVRIVGRLKEDRWEDEDGRQKSLIKIVASHVEFKSKRKAPEKS